MALSPGSSIAPEGVPKEGRILCINVELYQVPIATTQQGPRQVTSRTCTWIIWRRSHGPETQSRCRSSSLSLVTWWILRKKWRSLGPMMRLPNFWHLSTFFTPSKTLKKKTCQCHLHLSCRLATPTGKMMPRSPGHVRMPTLQQFPSMAFWNS